MFAVILASFQILTGKHMRVVPAEARRGGGKSVTRLSPIKNHRRSFFHRTIDIRRQKKPMPVNNLAGPALVDYIYGRRPTLFEAQQRTRHLLVISRRPNGLALVIPAGYTALFRGCSQAQPPAG